MISKEQLKGWLAQPAPTEDLIASVRQSPSTPLLLEAIRRAFGDFNIPQTTYTRYREFEHTGERNGYQPPLFEKRSKLIRRVLEMIIGFASNLEAVYNLLWNICEYTSLVLPPHEE